MTDLEETSQIITDKIFKLLEDDYSNKLKEDEMICCLNALNKILCNYFMAYAVGDEEFYMDLVKCHTNKLVDLFYEQKDNYLKQLKEFKND